MATNAGKYEGETASSSSASSHGSMAAMARNLTGQSSKERSPSGTTTTSTSPFKFKSSTRAPGAVQINKGALQAVWAIQQGATSFRSIAQALDISPSTAYRYCLEAERCGLVEWQPGRNGTLRAKMEVVACG